MSGRDPREVRENVLLGLGCAVIGAWVVGFLVQIAFPSHPVPTEVHGIVAIIAPILFGSAAYQARKQDKGG